MLSGSALGELLPKSTKSRTAMAAVLALTLVSGAKADFNPGDFYGTSSTTVIHYDNSGAVVDSFTIPPSQATELRGLAFGPDGLLYIVAGRNRGFAVLAVDSDGNVQEAYEMLNGLMGGNISYGKISFGLDQDHHHHHQNGSFFVGTGFGLVRFDLGDLQSGTYLNNREVFAVKSLPWGNLLVASAYNIAEVTNTGDLVRTIQGNFGFGDLRGLEYDSNADIIYATMLGYSGYEFQLMALDGTSGDLLAHTYFWYGDDIFLTPDGYLIVGSRTQSPGSFDENLREVSYFGGGSVMFVTQVPE
jgi:hypothetical protein